MSGGWVYEENAVWLCRNCGLQIGLQKSVLGVEIWIHVHNHTYCLDEVRPGVFSTRSTRAEPTVFRVPR